MKVLIVEDNEVNVRILDITLRKQGYETIVAHDGRAGLDCLEEHPDIDLVVSDIMMPDMDGVELLTEMKQNEAWHSMPVIMCTAVGYTQTVKQVLALGCTDYVLKPIDTKDFVRRVAKALAA